MVLVQYKCTLLPPAGIKLLKATSKPTMDMVENVLHEVIENNKLKKEEESRKKFPADSRNMFEMRM